MDERSELTQEELIADLSDSIMASIIKPDELSKSNRSFAFRSLDAKVFTEENFVIYTVLTKFKEQGITPDVEFMKLYLLRSKKMFKTNGDRINLKAYEDLDEDPIVGYISAVMKQFIRLNGLVTLPEDELKLTIEKYKIEYSNYEMDRALTSARIILHEGMQIPRRFLQGTEDAFAFVKNKKAELEGILNKTTGEGFINSRIDGIKDGESQEIELVSDFDLIEELNTLMGGLYTGSLYNFLAPTKGGKSKFTTRLVHTAIVKYGTNVSVWAVEGGYKAWWAQLRAIHYEYMYIRNGDPGMKVPKLTQAQILKNKYPSEEVKALENASRIDLFTNENYGIVHMIERPFEVESFIDEIETSVQLNESKIVLLDYLQMVDGENAERENIKKGYQDLLRYVHNRNLCGITPAQFSQEFIKTLASGKDLKTVETRTGGGNSAEVVRTPDYNIGLYASPEDLQRKSMTIMAVPSRMLELFAPIPIYADLGICLFASLPESQTA